MDGPSSVVIKLCVICSVKEFRYACPRCNILYCSVACYQSAAHLRCSESFYKECIDEEMKSVDLCPESKRKMIEILKKQQELSDEDELDSDDDNSDVGLEERLANVSLDDANSVWEKLTKQERLEFEEMLRSGNAGTLLPPWQPWWHFRKEKRKVVEMGTICVDTAYKLKCPALRADIPSLTSFTRAKPALCVSHNLVNILASYVFMARRYNGDHQAFKDEAASTLITVSKNLSANHNYSAQDEAITSAIHEAVNCSWLSADTEESAQIKIDTLMILAGPDDDSNSFYVQAALSDCHRLMSAAKRSQSRDAKDGVFSKRFPDSTDNCIPRVTKDKLKVCLKKVDYFQSWVKDFYF